jgi:DNA-binding transcriptional LysR family regulator
MFRSFPQLETYYSVARLGSFRAAAEKLGVTQPSISVRIREMEAEAGGALFVRSSRGVRLTELGRSMFDQVERIMSLLSDLDGRVRSVGPLRGLLRLGVPDSFALCCMAKFMSIIEAEHPELTVSVDVQNSRLLGLRLEEGRLDLAILAQPESTAFRLEALGEQVLSWVASPLDDTISRALGPSDLVKRQIFTNPSPSPTFSILMDWFAGHGLVPPRINTCNSIAAIQKVAVSGGGICVLPTCVIQDQLDDGTLVELDVGPTLPQQRMFAAYPKGGASRALPQMVAAIRRAIAGTDFVVPLAEEEATSGKAVLGPDRANAKALVLEKDAALDVLVRHRDKAPGQSQKSRDA